MAITRDDAKYDQLHTRLLRDLLLAIKDELDAADLDHDEVHDLTARIGAAVSAVIDGTTPMEVNGERMQPFVAFSNEAHRDQLLVNDHGSYFHEVVDTLFEAMVAEEEDEEDEEEDDEDDYEYEDDEDEDMDDEDEDEERRH